MKLTGQSVLCRLLALVAEESAGGDGHSKAKRRATNSHETPAATPITSAAENSLPWVAITTRTPAPLRKVIQIVTIVLSRDSSPRKLFTLLIAEAA